MGCCQSQEDAGGHPSKRRSLYNFLHPSPALRPPTPPIPTLPSPKTPRNRRRALGSFKGSPYQIWQRRQMGGLFNSNDTTPTRSKESAASEIDRVSPANPPSPTRQRGGSSPTDKELPDLPSEADLFPPGTALPYAPSPPTPHDASSVYSATIPNTPADTRHPNQRSHSYRSFSGRMMYSPANFPANDSPYGTPTIRMVQKSTLDLMGGGKNEMQVEGSRQASEKEKEHRETWLSETTIDDDTFHRIGVDEAEGGRKLMG